MARRSAHREVLPLLLVFDGAGSERTTASITYEVANVPSSPDMREHMAIAFF